MLEKKFDYLLPEDKIALFPVENRDQSKLLYFDGIKYYDKKFEDIENILSNDSILIRNKTKVVKARLFLRRENSKIFEVFCLNQIEEDNPENNIVKCECLIKNVKKLKVNEVLFATKQFNDIKISLEAKFLNRKNSNSIVEFKWNNNNLNFDEVLDIFGSTALPPYIKRKLVDSDTERYQTVYASKAGSVAAPTAGLHFTHELDEKLIKKGIKTASLVLHVGIDTFQPLKSENIRKHEMHSEIFEVEKETIEILANSDNKKIIAVGTTSLRTLESLYILGHRILNCNSKNNHFIIEQWEAEKINVKLEPIVAWKNILTWMNNNKVENISGNTSLIITDQHICRSIDYIITNFHQPNSTLLLIIASLLGDDWKKTYQYALNNNYRFLSYGDACLFKNLRK